MANFDDIDEARVLLGLSEEATLKQIKSSYRRLARKYHPDICKTLKCQEVMKEINKAFELISKYCGDYCYSFHEIDVGKAYPMEEYWRKWKVNWRF